MLTWLYLEFRIKTIVSFSQSSMMAKALQFVNVRRMVHLDVKPDNAYVKNGVYKLGDFGCATLLNKSCQLKRVMHITCLKKS
ncbi:hypothetical protein ES332_D11G131500v1 [Gossypium tomentosum]|uniref:Protein kinase domain-containing protein n=1 Tax=Gossypium tomentosum TaxID=34277 RepID=A0A5D2IMI2_GOSTO|nr:hypothetical protein ES332_D11G131500v1 [Gossypium tomentosum]